MIVALRIIVVRDGNGVYVLGNGFARGTDVEPGSGAVLVSVVAFAVLVAVLVAGVGAWLVLVALAQPSATRAQPRKILERRIQ